MSLFKKHSLKIVSVVLGFLIFVTTYDLGTPFWESYFYSTQIIEGVDLEITHSDDYIVTNLPQSVDVKIKGSQSEVKKVIDNEQSLSASSKLEIKESGTYKFDPSKIEFNSTANVQFIILMDPVELQVSKKASKSMSVATKLTAQKDINSSHIISDYTLSNNSVNVLGSEEKIDDISRVELPVNISKLDFNQQKAITKSTPIAYDVNGNVINDVVFDPPSINVELISNDQFIELPLSYIVINNNSDLYVSEICKLDEKCGSKDVVKVYGDLSAIEKMNNVKYEIDLSEKKDNYTATPILPQGVFISDDATQNVTIKMQEGAEKEIKDVPISVNNLSDNFQAKTVENKSSMITVKIKGAKSIVEKLTKDDLNMSIDLSDISQIGNYEVPIEISGSGLVEYELENKTMNVEVVEVE